MIMLQNLELLEVNIGRRCWRLCVDASLYSQCPEQQKRKKKKKLTA